MYDLNRPWQQTSDLEAAPFDAPLVCVEFNASWLPVVLGALMQLGQAAQWLGDDAAQQAAVTASTQLMLAIGQAEECVPVQFRFTSGCVLQYSVDGGTTWIDTPGWTTFAPGCFTGPEGPTGPTGGFTPGTPGNPQGDGVAQQACNVAAYLTTEILQASLQQTVNSITAAQTLFNTVLAVVALLPGVDVVLDLVLGAGAILFNLVSAGTLSDFTSALADATLWAEYQCAIWNAIKADGFVTPSNWTALVANVTAITYVHTDVTVAINNYIVAIGEAGLEGLQLSGALYVGDCSACSTGGWCYAFSPALSDSDFERWAACPNSAHGTYVLGTGWQSVFTSTGGGEELLSMCIASGGAMIVSVEVTWVSCELALGGFHGVGESATIADGTLTDETTGTYTQTVAIGTTISTLRIEADARLPSPGGKNYITAVTVRGTGVCPFGTPNCV